MHCALGLVRHQLRVCIRCTREKQSSAALGSGADQPVLVNLLWTRFMRVSAELSSWRAMYCLGERKGLQTIYGMYFCAQRLNLPFMVVQCLVALRSHWLGGCCSCAPLVRWLLALCSYSCVVHWCVTCRGAFGVWPRLAYCDWQACDDMCV